VQDSNPSSADHPEGTLMADETDTERPDAAATLRRDHAGYGWVPDLPDRRDHLYVTSWRTSLPAAVDLRRNCPPVYDQGQLGSCTANAIAAAFEYDLQAANLPDFMPSRLFIYYGERLIEGTVREDAGAMIRDGIKVVAKTGVCPESEWPYDVSQFAERPPARCFTDARRFAALSYARIDNDRAVRSLSVRARLAAGHPVVFGFAVHESFESDEVAHTGVMPMPEPGEALLGGHAVLAVGYDDTAQHLIVRNSWGASWGQAGYFTMPYAYAFSASASDFWVILKVS
jgi:C1A family cysteine protease